jgi:hypothetical protein
MKKYLALLVLTAATALAQTEINLGAHGKISLFLIGEWKVDVSDLGDRTVTIKPKNPDINADCTLTILHPDQDLYARKDKLKMRVEIDSAPYADQSVEKKAVAKPFDVKTGFGYHCDFTDPDLIGKPPQPGNYKTLSTGLIRLAPDVLVQVVIEADGFTSEPYQQLLGAIEGMDFTPGRG